MGKQLNNVNSNERDIDIIVRIFHGLTMVLFITLFITGITNNSATFLHILLGYLLISLIISRVVWAFLDSGNANWKNYFFSIKTIINYLSSLFKEDEKHSFKLHNPAGSSMILLMLSFLTILVVSGLLTQALFEFDGILLFTTKYLNDQQAFFIKNVHLIVAYFMLFLISFHIMGVLYSSKKYKVNMPLMMINGKINKGKIL